MKLENVAKAYAAGSGGAIVFLIVFAVLNAAQVTPDTPFPGFWYKQIVWGGIWGFVFLVPLFGKKWWLRGLVVGTLATLAAVLIFGLPAVPRVIVLGLILNAVVWGLSTAWLNDVLLKNRP